MNLTDLIKIVCPAIIDVSIDALNAWLKGIEKMWHWFTPLVKLGIVGNWKPTMIITLLDVISMSD
jgi:hypothetical protein